MKFRMLKGWSRLVKQRMLPLLACGLLASCASLIGPRTVDVPQTRLQQGLERRFPVNHRVLAVFDLQLAQPQLQMLPAEQRIALTLDTTLASPLMKNTLHGNLLLSGRLALDPARNAVYLADARVDKLTIDGLDDSRQRQLAGIATVIVDKLVKDMPLYNYQPDELRYAGVQFVPGELRVTPTGLSTTLTPAQ